MSDGEFQDNDAFQAGRLIQWGLRVRERPATQSEYQLLVDRYLDNAVFRDAVRQTAAGLGLNVLECGEHGLALGPETGSVFELRGASFRSGRSSTDDRLLDGLIQVAIAATVFPTSQELMDDADIARPPVTVDEVDENLRRISNQLAEQARRGPDVATSEEEAGLHEAWRVYHRRVSVQQTRDNRAGSQTTHRIIERNLNRLQELGCFMSVNGHKGSFQATWRYHVLVRDLAATSLYRRIQELLDRDEARVEAPA